MPYSVARLDPVIRASLKPSYGKKLRLLSGSINHVTGTKTLLTLKTDDLSAAYGSFIEVAAITATGIYELNSKVLTDLVRLVDTLDVWIAEPYILHFASGDAAAYALLYYEEVQV